MGRYWRRDLRQKPLDLGFPRAFLASARYHRLKIVESEYDNRKIASDRTDDESAFLAPYLTLMQENALRREYELRKCSIACAALCGKVPNEAQC